MKPSTPIPSHWFVQCCALLAALLVSPPAQPAEEFLDWDKAFRLSMRLKDPQTVEVRYDIAKGYYMYRSRFSFAVEGARLGTADIPPGKPKFDPVFKETMETFRDAVVISLPVQDARGPIVVKASAQGCADAGVCYPPTTQSMTLRLANSSAPVGASSSGSGLGGLFKKPGQ